MSEDSQKNDEKPHEPTQRKLDEARRKGEIARSPDLVAAASYGGFLVAALAFGGVSLSGFALEMSWFLAQPDRIADLLFAGSAASTLRGVGMDSLAHLAPWFLLPPLMSLASLFAMRVFLVTPSRLAPKLSRVSLIANAGQKFGRKGLFEFAKSFAKLLIYAVTLLFFLQSRLDNFVRTIWYDPRQTMLLLFELSIVFLAVVFLVSVFLGIIDYLWQLQDHLRNHRMSHKDLRDESKESEGDPHIKQERRRRAFDLANNRMLLDVPKADVVIVNPTHFAVALKWSRKPGEAPVCVAKGQDEVAMRMRALAIENAVPMLSDPPTARALFATTKIGDEISPKHYRAVAAAIRFAEKMRRKRRVLR